jgi:hypothetical protein
MTLGFDIISDLSLTYKNKLDWEGKPTSLFCIIAGNITNDLRILAETLLHLSQQYHGIFFIDGPAEIGDLQNHTARTEQIANIANSIQNVVYLHTNVVIIDGVALVGINGWFGNYMPTDEIDQIRLTYLMHEDVSYLKKTIEKLQLHVDVRKIVVISNAVPTLELFYNDVPFVVDDDGLNMPLSEDTERKVDKWIFGSSDKMVDTTLGGINYVNNGCFGNTPYWPKRIEISL